jgi:hypothetical protein
MTEFRTSAIRIFANYQICAVAKETAAQARTASRPAQAILPQRSMHYERAPRGYEKYEANSRSYDRSLWEVVAPQGGTSPAGISKAGDVIGTNGNVYSARIERAFWLTGHGDLLRQERGEVYERSSSWSSIECLSGSMR